MKRFAEWLKLKERLDGASPEPPFISEGDLWWASLGENVGHEIDGKDADFARPVIVHTRLSRETFLAIPTTTQAKRGSWYVWFEQKEKRMAACLHQVRVVDHRRLLWKIGALDIKDFSRVKDGFNRLYE